MINSLMQELPTLLLSPLHVAVAGLILLAYTWGWHGMRLRASKLRVPVHKTIEESDCHPFFLKNSRAEMRSRVDTRADAILRENTREQASSHLNTVDPQPFNLDQCFQVKLLLALFLLALQVTEFLSHLLRESCFLLC